VEGIGEKTATKILEERKKNGNFKNQQDFENRLKSQEVKLDPKILYMFFFPTK
jgi:DNA uptake protein ComE-like DNA-binding protein